MTSRIINTARRFSSTNIAPIIQRHGPGDGVITLNVGGKNFQTLRSTVAQNDVLMDHVVRAETNLEIAKDMAIFIDRDPKHFGLILAYLRNKADGVYRRTHPSVGVARKLMKFGNKSNGTSISNSNQCSNVKSVTTQVSKTISTTSLIQLPKDPQALTEVYFESAHYNIPELTDAICSQQSLTRIFGLFGSKNPFQMATTAIVAGKRFLVLFGGVVTGLGGWVYTQAMMAQAKTNQFLADRGCEERGNDAYGQVIQTQTEQESQNQTDFWKNQATYWNIIADKWNGSTGEK